MGQEQTKSKPRPAQIREIADIGDLRKSCKGPIYTPTDLGYEENRRAWNWDATGFPSAIVTVFEISDIQAVVAFARKHKLDLCIAGGRHSHLCMVTDSLVLDMSAMKKIEVDVEKKQAVVQAGVKLGALDAELERHGLVVPAGHNPDTGIAGLTLGGGLGYLVRHLGMTIDSLLRIRLVTADGELITVDEDNHPDLFWALRGGGGNFGVVVDFTFKAHPVPAQVLAGSMVFLNVPMLDFMFNDPSAITKKVRDYYVTMPNEVGGVMVMPFGGPLVTVWCHAGSIEEGTKEFAKFDFSSPINTIKPMSYQTGVQKLVEKEQPPAFYWEKGCLLTELTDDVLDLLWKLSHDQVPAGVKGVIVVNPIGGKMADVPVDATAFEQRNAKYWILLLGKWENYEEKNATVDWIRHCARALSPYASGSYAPVINVPEGTDFECDAGNAVFSKNADKLVAVKQKYDPENVFRMNRNINVKK